MLKTYTHRQHWYSTEILTDLNFFHPPIGLHLLTVDIHNLTVSGMQKNAMTVLTRAQQLPQYLRAITGAQNIPSPPPYLRGELKRSPFHWRIWHPSNAM